MKTKLKYQNLFLALIFFSISNLAFQNLYCQNSIKNKVRLQAYYFKIMDSTSYLNIKATSKIDKKINKLSNITLTIYNLFESDEIQLGKISTSIDGEAKFIIQDLNTLKVDSTGYYNLKILFKGNDSYKKATKTIDFKDASINTKIFTKDSINYITAQLFDKNNNQAIADSPLTIQVIRLFKPLILGDPFNMTDDNGSISSTIENGIPGVNGNIFIEVVLDDSDEYGTVIDIVKAPIGVPFVDESTFDERTMWSPRSKTPYFLLIIPNVLTFGMWTIIVILIVNLFKIRRD